MDAPNNRGRNGQYYDSASSGEPDAVGSTVSNDDLAAFQRYCQANIAAANNGISNPSSTRGTYDGLNSYAASPGDPDPVGSTASNDDIAALQRYLILSSMNSQANNIAAATNRISNPSSTHTYTGLNSYSVPRTVYSMPTTAVAPTTAGSCYALLQSGLYSAPNSRNVSYEPRNNQGLNSSGGVQSRGLSTGSSQLQNLSQSDTYSYSSLLPTYSYSTLPSAASTLPSTYSYSTLPNTSSYSTLPNAYSNSTLPNAYSYSTLPIYSYSTLPTYQYSTLPTYQCATLPAYSYSTLPTTTSPSRGNAELLMLLLTGQQARVSRNHEEVLEQYLETRSDMQILSSCIQDDCVPGLSGGVDMDKLSGGVDMDRLSSGVDMGKTRIEASHQFADSPVKLEKAKRKRKSAQGSESAKPSKKVTK